MQTQNQSLITTESTLNYPQGNTPSNSRWSLSSQSRKAVLLGTLSLLGLISLFFCKGANAELVIGEQLAVRTILGEAEGEIFDGKIAVSEVLRNRRSVKGFYGAKAIRFDGKNYWRGNRKIDSVTVGQALKAWRESERTNLTKNATHFENVEAFGVPYWAHSMTPTVKIGSHQFYREVRR